MMTATQVCKLKMHIQFNRVDELLSEIGTFWWVIEACDTELEMVNKADASFFESIQSFFAITHLSECEGRTASSMIQRYLIEHPLRSSLLKMAAQREMLKTNVIMVLDSNKAFKIQDSDSYTPIQSR